MALSFAEKMERVRAEHRPWGDPCRRKGCGLPKLRHFISHTFQGAKEGPCLRDGCGLPLDNHHVRFGGANRRYRSLALVPEPNGVVAASTFYPIGVDGEGVGHGEGVDHRYVLLAARDAATGDGASRCRRYIEVASDGHTYDELGDRLTKAPRLDKDGRPYGLATSACLDFFLSMPRKSKCFGFSFGYDLSMMLRDIDPRRLFLLTHPELRARPVYHKSGAPEPVLWADPLQAKSAPPYILNLQGRRFSVARKNSRGVLRRTVIWDIFAFFGKSFVDVLEIENIGTPEHRAFIRSMKKQRATFSDDDREAFRAYCLDECRDTAEIVERLVDSHEQVGLRLRNFYGPGSSADAMLHQMGIRQAVGRIKKTTPANLRALEKQLLAEYKKKGFVYSLPRRIQEVDAARKEASRAVLPADRRPKDYWTLQLLKLGLARLDVPVLDAQRILSVAETGEVDDATKRALQQFQLQHQLPATGSIDAETSAALLYFRHKYESNERRETDLRAKRQFNESLGNIRRKHLSDVMARGIEDKIEFEQRKRVAGPDKMRPFVMAAFFGGRFEHSVMGVIEPHLGDAGPDRRCGIWAYDMSQAYPAATLSLPCLLHATWEFTMDEARFAAAEHALVRYTLGTPPKGLRWAPLPYRTERGSHIYPARSGGGWVWAREFRAAQRVWNKLSPDYVQFRGAWIYGKECACPNPFTVGGKHGTGIAGYYLERLRFGKDARGLTIKGGINSCFGKLCQSAGKDPIYQSYIWSGMITSHTRARNLEFMGVHRDMNNVLSIATDGVLSLEYFNDDRLPPPDPSKTGEGDLPPEVRQAIAERNAAEMALADAEGRAPKLELFHRPLGGWERRRIGTDKEPKALFLMKPGVVFPLNPSAADLDHVRARGFGRSRLVNAALGKDAGDGSSKSGGDLLVEAWLAAKRDDLKEDDSRKWISVALPARPCFHGIRSSIREVPCAPEEAHAQLNNRRVAYRYAAPNTPGARPLPNNPSIWAMHNGKTFEIEMLGEDDPRPSHVVQVHIKYVASDNFLTWTNDEVHESFSPLPKRAAVIRKGRMAVLPLRSCDDPGGDDLKWSSAPYAPQHGIQRSEERLRALTQKMYYLDADDSFAEEAETIANEGAPE